MQSSGEQRIFTNPYPGRGIVTGLSPDAESLVQVYWIMGRSENSRNRIFVREGGDVRTKAYLESRMRDPSLIIYYPVRTLGENHIVTNGDQTDTVAEFIKAGKSFEEALLSRGFEPDAPNYTPRISSVGLIQAGKATVKLSVLSTVSNNPAQEKKVFYEYTDPVPGEGYCIHTYAGDGDPLPSFQDVPFVVPLENGPDANAVKFWALLNEENRVSLLVKHVELSSGEITIRIINRYND